MFFALVVPAIQGQLVSGVVPGDATMTADDNDSTVSPFAGLKKKMRPEGSPSLKEYSERDPIVVIVCPKSDDDTTTSAANLAAGIVTANPIRAVAGAAGLTRSRDFRAVVDGEEMGEFSPGEICQFSISPGSN